MSSKRSQARVPEYLRLIFTQIPGAIWATDRDLRLTYVNGRTRLLDAAAAQRLVGDTIYRFVGSSDPTEPVVAHHLAALAGGRQSFQYQRRSRTFEVLVEPLRDDAGAIVGCVGAAIDVTERRDTQDQLARSQARLAEAQRVAHVGSFEWEVPGDVVTWSPELRRIYAAPQDAATEPLDGFLARIHPEDRGRVRDAVLHAVRNGKPFALEYRIVRPAGDIRVLHAAGDVIGQADRSPLRVVGSCWDITEQQETTEKLHRSVSLLEATLDSTADGILVVDTNGRIAAHNHRFTELWRVPASSIAPGNDASLLLRVSDQLENPDAFRNGVRELYASPEREALDVLRFNDGRVFERYSKPQRVDGRIAGRVWSFRDVTERERLLQRATFLADATRLLASLDVDRALGDVARLAVPYLGEQCVVDVLAKGAAHRLLGVPDADPLLPVPQLHQGAAAGHSVLYDVGTRSAIAVPLLCRDVVAGGITVVAPREREYTRQDLELVEELARRMALSLDNARLFEGAREAVASRDEFLSIAAHEIRGPLTSIHLAVQGLLRKTLSLEATRSALEIIQREDRRLARFVDDLLDLGRLRTGQLHLTLEEVDLGTTIRDVVSRLSEEVEQSGSALTVTTSGDLVGHWDGVRLEQVVTNLVSNAIKFGKGQPIQIDAEEVNGRARMRVADHGIGIAPAVLPRIFDPFARGVDARHYGGLGLGLHIAKTIVDGLGGTLTASSAPDEGATFTVELPTTRSGHDHETHSGGG